MCQDAIFSILCGPDICIDVLACHSIHHRYIQFCIEICTHPWMNRQDKCMAPVNGSKGLFSFDSLPPGVALSVLQVLHDCLAGSSSLVLSGRSKGIQQEIARGIRRSVQRCRELQRCAELLWLLMTSYDFLDLLHLVSSCFPLWVSNCGRCGRAGGILQLEFVKPRRLPSMSKRSSWQFWCRPLAWTDTACFMS